MTEQQTNEHSQRLGTTMTRRGIVAAAGAVVAAVVAKHAALPVTAVDGSHGDGGTLIIGANDIFGSLPRSKNTATNPTQLTNTSGTVTASPTSFFHQGAGLIVTASDGAEGIMGFANGPFGVGIWGVSNRGRAVYGELTGSGAADGGKAVVGDALGNTNAYGVYGSASSASSTGVYGLGSQGIGVHGESTSGIGVQGLITGSIANTVAIKGSNQSTGTSGIGIVGQCDTTTGIGVQGQSIGGVGVFGVSNGNAGVLGISNAPGNVGVGGIANVAGTAAFAGTSTNPSAFAGFFTGDVFVNGNFTVQDPTRKHGAIAHPDGSYRILYSMESPESWLEDFGKGTLANGKADVKLDPDFAVVVHTEDYHVFLTPYDGVGALRVVRQTATGFGVEEIGGASNGAFRYRVVAKPKSTNRSVRMAKFTIPDINVPQPPPMVTTPTAKAPDGPPQAAPPTRAASPAAKPQQGSAVTSTVQPLPPPRSG